MEVLNAVFGGLKERYLSFDLNGDGIITIDEFRQVLESMPQCLISTTPAAMEVLNAVFGGLKERYLSFDLNGDGIITIDEFRQVLESMVGERCPDSDWAAFVSKVDYNQSNTLEFEEFLYALFLWFCDEDSEERDEVDSAFKMLRMAFVGQDRDKDDQITLEETQAALQALAKDRAVAADAGRTVYQRLNMATTAPMSFKSFLYAAYIFVHDVCK
eukprot:m51a1_g9412 hypothetical protein (215) ;mRNA; r:342929-344527